MTGFGRGEAKASCGRLIAEIQAVNRKHFEVQVHLPKELSRFENELRKQVSEAVLRGHVALRIQFLPSGDAMHHLLPDAASLQSLKKAFEKLAKELKLDPKAIDLPFLMQHMPAMQKTDLFDDKEAACLRACVDKAIKAMLVMKEKEGKALVLDIASRLKTMRGKVASIEKLAPEASGRMRQKLQEKLRDLFGASKEIDERILREVALFAEKVDIAEEVTRLHSHFAQFEEVLRGKEKAVGKKMEFIVQEMGREINTIGSKSAEAKISTLVVDIKSELEKIREQIQNIE